MFKFCMLTNKNVTIARNHLQWGYQRYGQEHPWSTIANDPSIQADLEIDLNIELDLNPEIDPEDQNNFFDLDL